MGEVEAQLVGPHVRARLAHVGAEPLAQRGVQQVGGGVVAHRGEPVLALDHRARRLARADLALQRVERQGLVVAEPEHVDHPGAAGGGLQHAGVRHLAAALRVEGALLELGQQAAVLGARSRRRPSPTRWPRSPRSGSGSRPAARTGPRSCVAISAASPRPARGRRPSARSPAPALHQLLEALVVHGQALVGKHLLGHLEREAERVVQTEGVLGRAPTRCPRPWPRPPARQAASRPARACGRSPPPRPGSSERPMSASSREGSGRRRP